MNALLESLACSGSECLCWMLVLLNIFAVFYLVFCSFWKVSRMVKICGWVYSGILIFVTVLILFFHTCIYTLLATVFTGMMLMAILAIILPQQGEFAEKPKKEKAEKPLGAYVISETLDGWFVFELYDARRKKLATSTYAYASVDEAKEKIFVCRDAGKIAETEDRSGLWIQEKPLPKFTVCKYGDTYGFSLQIVEGDSILRSEKIGKASACLSLLERAKANVGATDIYMSVEKILGDGFERWNWVPEEPAIEEPIEEEPAVEEPVEAEPAIEEPIEEEPAVEEPVEEEPAVEDSVEEEPAVEEPAVEEPVEEEPTPEESVAEQPVEEEVIPVEPARPKKCIVGVVWPESSNANKVYRYLLPEGAAEVGDTVIAPTFDSFNKREVMRKACVVSVELYEDGDDIVLPKKAVVSVEKKNT